MAALWSAIGLQLDCHRRSWTEELRRGLYATTVRNGAHLTDLWARKGRATGKLEQGRLLSKIKIHAALHIPEYIRLFGPPLEVDTGKFEANHKRLKKGYKKTSKACQCGIVSDTAVLQKANEEAGLAW
eukprot:4799623-Prorocentrum_lima.AAC.1